MTAKVPSRSLLPDGSVTAVARALGKGHDLALGTADGRVIPVTIEFVQNFQGDERSISPSVTVGAPIVAAPTPHAITKMAYQKTESGGQIAALLEDKHLWLTASETRSRPDGTADASIAQVDLTPIIPGRVTALTLGSRAEILAVGTDEGHVYHLDIREPAQPVVLDTTQASERGQAITALAYLMGDRSLVVGSESGQITVWMPVREHSKTNATHMKLIHRFVSHPTAVTDITISQRDKGFITTDSTGEIRLHHSTSEQTLLVMKPAMKINSDSTAAKIGRSMKKREMFIGRVRSPESGVQEGYAY
jgi:phosphate transport system permease protein